MLALFLVSGGDFKGVIAQAELALALGTELQNPSLLALSNCALGYALSTTHPELAMPHLENAISISAIVANEQARDVSARRLARVKAALGDLLGALEIYATSLDYTRHIGATLAVALTCESLAVDLSRADIPTPPRTIFGAPSTGRRVSGNPFVGRGATIEHLRETMSESVYEACAAARPDHGQRRARRLHPVRARRDRRESPRHLSFGPPTRTDAAVSPDAGCATGDLCVRFGASAKSCRRLVAADLARPASPSAILDSVVWP